MKSILKRGGLGLALAACCSMAALAGPSSDKIRIDVRTKYDTVETVVLEDLAAGEVRSLSTAAGNPALATRTDTGIKLELAGETFDVALPDPDSLEEANLGAGAKVVKIRKHEVKDEQHAQHKTVVVERKSSGDSVDQAIEKEIELGIGDDVDAAIAMAADPGPLAEGQRIRVIRELRREEQQVER
jgi:hypothetical protein